MKLKQLSVFGIGVILVGSLMIVPYVFAQEATEEATVEATEEATVEATEEATVEATEEATEEATVEATEEATVEATEEATAEATEAATPPAGPSYVIQPGDTLYRIATRYGLTVTQLAAYNNIVNPSLIYWGQTLEIPEADEATGGPSPEPTEATVIAPTEEATEEMTEEPEDDATGTTIYTVQTGDNLYRISLRYGTTIERLIELNDIQNANLIFAGQALVVPAT